MKLYFDLGNICKCPYNDDLTFPVICCQNLFVSSVCSVYDDYPNIIGQYTGENVVDTDGSVGFKYTHNTNTDVTLELYSVNGNDRVS